MKNIAIIVPTLNKGGAERVAANLSIEFSKYYNVYIITHDGNNITYPYKGNLISLDIVPTNNKFKKVINFFKRVVKLRKIKRKYEIDYSISHLPSSNLVNIFSRKNDVIYTYVHSMIKPTLKNKIREKTNAKFSDKVICVSECARQNMIKKFNISDSKLVTIYNFCEPIVYKKSIQKKDHFVVVNVGRLSEPKGQWHLIRAMKYVCNVNNNIKLKIFGEGEYRNNLELLIKKLKLEKNIELCGYVKNPFEQISKADLYVSSSLREGLPMSLIEAGFCNLPIISTDCDAGCREILAPNTPIDKKTNEIEYAKYGILVPVCKDGTIEQFELTENEKVLGDSILYMFNNEKKRKEYCKLSLQRSYDFTPEKIMYKWKEILK